MKVKLLDYRNTHQFRVDGIMRGHKLKREKSGELPPDDTPTT